MISLQRICGQLLAEPGLFYQLFSVRSETHLRTTQNHKFRKYSTSLSKSLSALAGRGNGPKCWKTLWFKFFVSQTCEDNGLPRGRFEAKNGTTYPHLPYKGMKRFWQFIKLNKKDNQGVATLKTRGKTSSTPTEKTSVLNEQFQSVFSPTNKPLVTYCQPHSIHRLQKSDSPYQALKNVSRN